MKKRQAAEQEKLKQEEEMKKQPRGQE